MAAIETLMHEHRIIEKVLGAVEREAGKASRDEKVDERLLAETIDFIRNFADKCHHHKEEGVLFKEMVAKGVPQEGGPVGVMMAEHDAGRLLVGKAREALAAHDGPKAAGYLGDYATLLRRHIQKEDTVLYVLARRVLGEDGLGAMAETFERVEAEEMGEGTHERYHELAHRLAEGRTGDGSA